MILFKQDWNKERFKNATIDWSTKNTTFIDLVALLEHMGVENRFFHLSLLDRSLKGIDPNDEGLPDDIKLKVLRECKLNPWYFFREVINVPSPGSAGTIPYQANRFNISLLWLFFNHITSIGICPRQIGKSFAIYSLVMYLINIGCNRTSIGLLTKDDALRTKTLKDTIELFDRLPKYLNFKTKKDLSNTEQITVNALENKFSGYVGQSSKQAANKVGRGHTSPVIVIDEGPFINNLSVSLQSMLPAMNTAVDNAKKNKAHHGLIFTTTAGFLSDPNGRFFKEKIYDAALPWNEKYFDCHNEEHLRETIRKNNTNRLGVNSNVSVLLQYNHRQLGKTDEWLREKIEQSYAEGENLEADFFNKWGKGTTESPIPSHILDIMADNTNYDFKLKMYTVGNYTLRVHTSLEEFNQGYPNRKGVIAIDPSEANGKDDLALLITDAYTGEVLCAANIKETNLNDFNVWLLNLMLHLPRFVCVIEKRSTGASIIDGVIALSRGISGFDPLRRFFNWIVNDMDADEEYKKVINTPTNIRHAYFLNKYKSKFGFATSGAGRTSRGVLYGRIFTSACKLLPKLVKDPELYKQLSGLVYQHSGTTVRINHTQDGNDDLVICWLLSFWFLTTATNKKYYGLPPEDVLQGLEFDNELEVLPEEKKRKDNIKAEMTKLKNMLNQPGYANMKEMIIGRYEKLASEIGEDGNIYGTHNTDELHKEMKKKQELLNITERKRYF